MLPSSKSIVNVFNRKILHNHRVRRNRLRNRLRDLRRKRNRPDRGVTPRDGDHGRDAWRRR